MISPVLEASAPVLTDDGAASAAGRRGTDLGGVDHWLYLIDVNLADETVAEIAASAHDMVVIDFITSEAENTDYPLAETIATLKARPVAGADDRLVLAYIDIGQAEDYRTYWQEDWRVGDPAWITALDPDGWEGNYPVAFWTEAYQDIWLADGGYLDQIVAAGFDGVYLDWVEAYDDENVIAAAESDGVDPRDAMVEWVAAIAAHGRAYADDFLVIGQNAADLLTNPDYRATIDAIAQEQIWFDGAADNDPPGDCPLPATEADVDTDAYVDSLSSPCREQYETYPDSTLHVSSAWYLEQLAVADAHDIPVFTVDYALDSDNVATVVETSRGLGYVPFVGSRALDTYVAPYPLDPGGSTDGRPALVLSRLMLGPDGTVPDAADPEAETDAALLTVARAILAQPAFLAQFDGLGSLAARLDVIMIDHMGLAPERAAYGQARDYFETSLLGGTPVATVFVQAAQYLLNDAIRAAAFDAAAARLQGEASGAALSIAAADPPDLTGCTLCGDVTTDIGVG